MKSSIKFLLLILSFLVNEARGQTSFNIRLDTLIIQNMPGLHSFAAAEHDGKWLLIGGRRDGLHPKFGGFDKEEANTSIYVVDPASGEVWEKENSELPDTMREQLQSANMEFYQSGELLCFVGGYGESTIADEYITYPYLTLIDVPGLMEAVMQDSELAPFFQTICDTFFAVAGGQLQMLEDTFYLVGGNYFEGEYTAEVGINFIQIYTEAIRKFTLEQTGDSWSVTSRSEIKDEFNLHRRDYNLAPQVLDDGKMGLVSYSGVFQPEQALRPFLNIVEITPAGHSSVNGFNQFLANYHCAKVPLYEQSTEASHTLFFGGISQYYLNANDSLIKDFSIPFVKTISRVSRLPGGNYEEVAFEAKMPFYTGSSAEFLLAPDIPTLSNGMVDYDQLSDGETLIGYIVGGIVTPDDQPNPFLDGKTNSTLAGTVLLKVFLQKNMTVSTKEHLLDGSFDLKMEIFPNPALDVWNVAFNLPGSGQVWFFLQNSEGRIVRQVDMGKQAAGENQYSVSAKGLIAGAYLLTINVDGVYLETRRILKIR